MQYSDSNRGVIQNRERKRQIIDYSGLRYGNITPTDIDGLIEYHGEAYVLIEIKHGDAQMPYGQRLAIQRIVNDLASTGKLACAMVCTHDVDDVTQDVDAASTIVTAIYYNGEWIDGKGRTLKESTDIVVNHVDGRVFSKWG